MRVSTFVTIAFLLPPLAEPGNGANPNGEMIFQEHCVRCHGRDGKAQTELGKKAGAADLTSDMVQRLSNSELETFVKDGKGSMPAAGKILSDEEIHAVIVFVREFGKKR